MTSTPETAPGTGTGASGGLTTSAGAAVAGAVDAAQLPRLRRRTAGVLIASQMLGGLGVPISIALAPVLATEISGTEALSGLASTAAVIGTALVSLPLAALMTARGRRPGLVVAYAIGTLGAALVVLAASVKSFPLLMLGMASFGAASSANLQARFAAADLAAPERRARSISVVVWASTIGAVLGPNLSAPASASFMRHLHTPDGGAVRLGRRRLRPHRHPDRRVPAPRPAADGPGAGSTPRNSPVRAARCAPGSTPYGPPRAPGSRCSPSPCPTPPWSRSW